MEIWWLFQWCIERKMPKHVDNLLYISSILLFLQRFMLSPVKQKHFIFMVATNIYFPLTSMKYFYCNLMATHWHSSYNVSNQGWSYLGSFHFPRTMHSLFGFTLKVQYLYFYSLLAWQISIMKWVYPVNFCKLLLPLLPNLLLVQSTWKALV